MRVAIARILRAIHDTRDVDIAVRAADASEVAFGEDISWRLRVHGLALGGGVELALACDYIVATPGASFGFPETGIGIYPGLFAYLDTARDKASRLRAGAMSVFFATGILAVVAALGLGVLLLQIGLATISNDSLFIVDLIGFPILALIGASYLLGINFMIPIPSAGLPGSLSNMRGLRAATSSGPRPPVVSMSR